MPSRKVALYLSWTESSWLHLVGHNSTTRTISLDTLTYGKPSTIITQKNSSSSPPCCLSLSTHRNHDHVFKCFDRFLNYAPSLSRPFQTGQINGARVRCVFPPRMRGDTCGRARGADESGEVSWTPTPDSCSWISKTSCGCRQGSQFSLTITKPRNTSQLNAFTASNVCDGHTHLKKNLWLNPIDSWKEHLINTRGSVFRLLIFSCWWCYSIFLESEGYCCFSYSSLHYTRCRASVREGGEAGTTLFYGEAMTLCIAVNAKKESFCLRQQFSCRLAMCFLFFN